MPEERENDPSEMTFLEHLEEMRFVILKTLAFFSVALILVLVFFHYFNSMMLYPLNSAKNILSKWVGTEQVTEVKTERIGPVYLVSDGDEKNKTGPFYIEPKDDSIVLFKDSKPSNPWYADIKLRSMSFATPIIVYFYVGFLGALGLSLPAAFYFAARFIAPGLKKEELDVLLPGIIAAIILFAIGVCFAFFFMLPMGIAFMSWMSQGMQLEMFPDAQSYYSMVIFLTIAVGITFELPLVEFILIYVGILDVKWLENNRRMVFLIILIFATVITPPDAITQVSLTIPLYLMYEVAMRLGKRMRRAKLRREAERERREAIEEEKERKEYAKTVAKERLAEEEAEKLEESQSEIVAEPGSEYGEIDRSHYELPEDYDPEGWSRLKMFADTVKSRELLTLEPAEVNRRLFWEESPLVTGEEKPAFVCSCSEERFREILRSVGREEAESILKDEGEITLTCRFCGRNMTFDRLDVEALFAGADGKAEA